jgi:hypothetical protein
MNRMAITTDDWLGVTLSTLREESALELIYISYSYDPF